MVISLVCTEVVRRSLKAGGSVSMHQKHLALPGVWKMHRYYRYTYNWNAEGKRVLRCTSLLKGNHTCLSTIPIKITYDTRTIEKYEGKNIRKEKENGRKPRKLPWKNPEHTYTYICI